MARASLRRYDVQAKVSLWVSIAAAVLLLGLFLLLMRNFRAEMRVFVYSTQGVYGPVVVCVTGLTLLLAAVGAAMGANSAGQRRNQLTKRSWLAFFLGSATLSATLILFAMFWFNRFTPY